MITTAETKTRAQTSGATTGIGINGSAEQGPLVQLVTPRGTTSMIDENSEATFKRPPANALPSLRFVPHIDPRSNRPSLVFAPVSRTLPHQGAVIRVGRYSEKESHAVQHSNQPSSAPIGFKSKVVSRRHCQFWFRDGQWYLKDNASSSGTFLNHVRLSAPGCESREFQVNDGDLVQLGIDFRGGEEMIFRCVKLRLELNRDWQKSLNSFK
jgi:pSer/pThr/pTyr-binding forkhead associated (FHA) protein